MVSSDLRLTQSFNSKILLLTCFLVPIFITPWFNLDPISLPRLALISVVGLTQLPNLLLLTRKSGYTLRFWRKLEVDVFTLLLVAFLTCGTITLFVAPKSIVLQSMGTDSRNAGFLVVLSISLICLSITKFVNSNKVSLIIYSILFGGALNLVYGMIQILDLDPVDWKNPYGPIIGTMGNPNFMSAYLGIFSILISSILGFKDALDAKTRIFLFSILITSIYLVLTTRSVQGLVVIGAGICIILLLRYKRVISKKYLPWIFLSIIALSATTALGFLGRGTLGNYLYQSTLEVRFFYWNAALSMIRSSPLFGHGFDSFGTWYTLFRSKESTELYGAGLVSDSAHNILLDLGVFGGVPLVASYSLIQILTLIKGIKVLRNKERVSWQYESAFVAWIGFQLQSLISPIQIVLLFTGFILGAVLWRDDLAFGKKVTIPKFESMKAPKVRAGFSIVLFLFMLVFTNKVLKADNDFRNAIVTGEGNSLKSSAFAWPLSERRLLIASRIFYANNYNDLGREIAFRALELNPNNLDVLRILVQDTSLREEEIEKLAERISKLDPHGVE